MYERRVSDLRFWKTFCVPAESETQADSMAAKACYFLVKCYWTPILFHRSQRESDVFLSPSFSSYSFFLFFSSSFPIYSLTHSFILFNLHVLVGPILCTVLGMERRGPRPCCTIFLVSLGKESRVSGHHDARDQVWREKGPWGGGCAEGFSEVRCHLSGVLGHMSKEFDTENEGKGGASS